MAKASREALIELLDLILVEVNSDEGLTKLTRKVIEKIVKKEKRILTTKDAIALLYKLRKEHYSKVLTVEFYKKNSDEYRIMTGRFGVKKGVTGKGLAFDPKEKDLIGFFDMNAPAKSKEEKANKGGFRFINIPGIRAIAMDGKRYEYQAEPVK